MILAELRALDVPALWAALSADRQAEIGAAALAAQLAQLVAEDDGTETTHEDRLAADAMADEAGDGLAQAIEEALPDIAWWSAPPHQGATVPSHDGTDAPADG